MLSFDDSLIVFVSIFYECRERRVFCFYWRNMWRRSFWEVHMTCERWMVYWGAIFCRLVQYTVE